MEYCAYLTQWASQGPADNLRSVGFPTRLLTFRRELDHEMGDGPIGAYVQFAVAGGEQPTLQRNEDHHE